MLRLGRESCCVCLLRRKPRIAGASSLCELQALEQSSHERVQTDHEAHLCVCAIAEVVFPFSSFFLIRNRFGDVKLAVPSLF